MICSILLFANANDFLDFLGFVAFFGVMFFIGWLRVYFAEKSYEKKRRAQNSVSYTSGGGQRNRSIQANPISKITANSKLLSLIKKHIERGGAKNMFLFSKDPKNNNDVKLESVIWIFCISHKIILDALEKQQEKQRSNLFSRSGIDYVKFRTLSLACASVIQQLDICDYSLPQICDMYRQRYCLYSEQKIENHFITLFSLLLNGGKISQEGSHPCLSVKGINEISLSNSEKIVAMIYSWMIGFVKEQGFMDIYKYSVASCESYVQWLDGIKDLKNRNLYVCCNRCNHLYPINQLDSEMTCSKCNDFMKEYWKKDAELYAESGISFKLNVHCKHCGVEYTEYRSDISHFRLCFECFSQFRNNFERLQKKHQITRK